MATEYRDGQSYNFDPDEFYERIEKLREKSRQGEAKTLLEEALQLSPHNTGLLSHLGVVLFEMDRTERAAEMFHRARDLGDEGEEIDYFLGESYFFMDRFSEAKRHYDTYLQKLSQGWQAGEKPDTDSLKRVSEIADSYYDNELYIEALKFFRFVFRNAAPVWMRSKDYLRAADCLHRLRAFPEEKYSLMDHAIMFANGHVNKLRERYALYLYDDGSFEEDKGRQADYANRAIELFEAVGIRKIKKIGSVKKLQLLYKYYRNWNNRTRKRMKQCSRRIGELEGKKKKRRSKAKDGRFKRIRKKDKRKRY